MIIDLLKCNADTVVDIKLSNPFFKKFYKLQSVFQQCFDLCLRERTCDMLFICTLYRINYLQ